MGPRVVTRGRGLFRKALKNSSFRARLREASRKVGDRTVVLHRTPPILAVFPGIFDLRAAAGILASPRLSQALGEFMLLRIAKEPGHEARSLRSVGGPLSRGENRVATVFPRHETGEQPCLDLEHSAIADAVVKQWVGHQRVHPLLKRAEECLAASGRQ